MYIDDVVSAFDVILHKGTLGEIYNIATRDEHSTLEVATDLLILFSKITSSQREFDFCVYIYLFIYLFIIYLIICYDYFDLFV
jgi:dTDP-D-glucose 4,6-dehydratase